MTASSGLRLLAALISLIVPAAQGQDSSARVISAPFDAGGLNPRDAIALAPMARTAPQAHSMVHGTALSAQLVSTAGIIFAGQVITVSRPASLAGITSTCTIITFQVNDGLRGISTGQILTIREWAGLWDRGERYRVGESVFLFLYPPSTLGLTSPVAGAAGRFSVDSRHRVVTSAQNSATFAADPLLVEKRPFLTRISNRRYYEMRWDNERERNCGSPDEESHGERDESGRCEVNGHE